MIAAAATAAYVYYRADEEIRRCVQQRIAREYPGLKVAVRSAELVERKGIEVRGLSIAEPGAEGTQTALFSCDEVFLSCATDLPKLLQEKVEIGRITLRRPTLRVTRRPDGSWSASRLLPLPKLSEHPPEVTVEYGTVEISDPRETNRGRLVLRDVNLTLSPPDPTSPTPQARRFRATLAADHLRGMAMEGLIDSSSMRFSVGGTVEGLDLSPELADAMPGPLAEKIAPLRGLRGQGTLGFRLAYDPAVESPYRFEIVGEILRGRLDDTRLPHPLTELRATFRASNEGFVVDELVARSGKAAVRIVSAHQSGFELGRSPLRIEAELRQLELDRELWQSLPETLRSQWAKYSPAGQIDADVRLHFDGQTWHPDLTVRCLDVSLAYYKFPYLLEHGRGTLTWKETPQGDVLDARLTAYNGTQEVHLAAHVLSPCASPTGWFEGTAAELQLDRKLLDALNEKSRAVVSSLNPSGTIGGCVRIWREAPGGPLHKDYVIGLNRCSIRYDKFPYPLGDLRGTLLMRDDEWTFHELEATNDTGRVVCQQGWLTSPQRGHELYLRLAATGVPLEEELRDALRDDIQQAWNSLRPRGTVDLVAEIHYRPEQDGFSLGVTACPQGDGTSIEPVQFPYRLEKLHGVLVYSDGRVSFGGRMPGDRFRGEHGPVKVGTTGYCDFREDGEWDVRFETFSVDGLPMDDRDLIQALPGRLKKAVVELRPVGPINLQGTMALQGRAGNVDAVRSQWDVTAVFRPSTSIDCGVKLENLSGSVTLVGASDGQHFQSRGELTLDSMTYKDFQFTQVMGPLWIDDEQVLLGSWVDRRRDAAAPGGKSPQLRPITARFCGGILYGDGWITPGIEPRYDLRATLSQADLNRLAKEVIAGRQNLGGTVSGTVNLRGAGRSLNGLGGQGTLQLREGNVYELPLMIALLKILSIRPPDQTAFSTSDVDFRIEGEHIYFDRINFNGDAISLLGRGEMDFEKSIRLTFYAMVGRGTLNIPLVRELFAGASQQIMQIHAEGTLQDPVIRKEPFPVVSQALQLLQEDLQRGAPSGAAFPQARQWMPGPVGGATRQ